MKDVCRLYKQQKLKSEGGWESLRNGGQQQKQLTTLHVTWPSPLDPGPYGIWENPFPLLLFLSKLNINLTIHQMRIFQPEPCWKTSWVRSSKRDPSVSCQVVFVSHSLTKGSQICQGLFTVQESQTCTTQVTEKGKEKFYQTHWPISTRPLLLFTAKMNWLVPSIIRWATCRHKDHQLGQSNLPARADKQT